MGILNLILKLQAKPNSNQAKSRIKQKSGFHQNLSKGF